MKELLIIVDMQNDFVTGTLANPAAQEIIDGIREFVDKFSGDILFTRDTHFNDYLLTQEGKKLPVPHCIYKTWGWQIVKEFDDIDGCILDKFTFGCESLPREIGYAYDKIYLVGTCTDICVISNAMILKAAMPDEQIVIIEDLCAGTTPENHQKAIDIMKICQIDIMTYKEKDNDKELL